MSLSKETQLHMFWYMLLARRLDERAWALHREGKIAFHISGIGHEAINVGAAFAIQAGLDWVAPYYRDLALMLALGLTPREFLLSLMGKKGDPGSDGRQMPGQWSLRRSRVLSHSSSAAAQCSHAVGVGLGIKLRGEAQVVLHCTGEGSTAQGEWYESVSWAALYKLPVIFLVENNQYAISMRQEQQMAVESVAEKARGLGLPGISVDGIDFLAVHRAVAEAAQRARKSEGPTLVEANTYRVTPHSSDDDDRSYRSREEVDAARRRDPLTSTKTFLETKKILSEEINEQMEAKALKLIEDALSFAETAPDPDPEEAGDMVYAQGERKCLP